jgi:hypothetical protein
MSDGFDTGRFGRLLALIAFVSAVFIITSAQTLDGTLFQLSVFAIGAVAVLTAMMGFLIAASAAYDEQQDAEQVQSTPESAHDSTGATNHETAGDTPRETAIEDR